MATERILVVAPQRDAAILEGMLRARGYHVTAMAGPVSDVLEAAGSVAPRLALVTVAQPNGVSGLAVGRALREEHTLPLVYVGEPMPEAEWARVLETGPSGFVPQPVDPWVLQSTVKLALRRHTDEARLRSDSEQYRLLFKQNVAGVYRKTVGGVLLNCNQSFARIFGYDAPDELEGKPADVLYGSPADRDAFLRRLRDQGSVTNHELPMRRKDGTPIWVLENAALTTDAETGAVVVVGTLIDITDRKTLEIRLERQANEDPLTGLSNRRALVARAEHALELAARRGEMGALLFVDVIRFKEINDRLGHRVGDQVLVEVARRLRATLRASDTAARVGGDEFAVLLSEVGGRVGARTAGHRVLSRFTEPVQVDGGELKVRLRVGIALFPEHAGTLDGLMKHAGGVVSELKSAVEPVVALYEPGGVTPSRSQPETAPPEG